MPRTYSLELEHYDPFMTLPFVKTCPPAEISRGIKRLRELVLIPDNSLHCGDTISDSVLSFECQEGVHQF